MEKRINVLIIGLGNSGSSAVQQLLMEYSNVGKFTYEEPGWITGELNHFRLPGMVADQLSEDTEKLYPDNLTQYLKEINRPKVPLSLLLRLLVPDKIYKLYKETNFTRNFAKNRINDFRKQQSYYDTLRNISCAFRATNDYQERLEITKQWLIKVNDIFGESKDFIVHKPIIHECHMGIWPQVFDPFKIIFVFRKPHDQMSTFLATSMIFRDMPWKYQILFGLDKGNRRLFHTLIDTTIMRINYTEQIEKLVGSDRFLKIDFEGLIDNYAQYKNLIENYLGLSEQDHIHKRMFFNPDESKLNINRFIDLLDDRDYEKLEPMEKWYEETLASVRAMIL